MSTSARVSECQCVERRMLSLCVPQAGASPGRCHGNSQADFVPTSFGHRGSKSGLRVPYCLEHTLRIAAQPTRLTLGRESGCAY